MLTAKKKERNMGGGPQADLCVPVGFRTACPAPRVPFAMQAVAFLDEALYRDAECRRLRDGASQRLNRYVNVNIC